MKYTNRLTGLIESISDIERAIETNNGQLAYHESNLIDQNGEVVKFHADQIDKYKSANTILQIALDYVMDLDIRRIHELEESETNKPILYEVVE